MSYTCFFHQNPHFCAKIPQKAPLFTWKSQLCDFDLKSSSWHLNISLKSILHLYSTSGALPNHSSHFTWGSAIYEIWPVHFIKHKPLISEECHHSRHTGHIRYVASINSGTNAKDVVIKMNSQIKVLKQNKSVWNIYFLNQLQFNFTSKKIWIAVLYFSC